MGILFQIIGVTVFMAMFLVIVFILKAGGHNVRQFIKSKLPWKRFKGAWFIQVVNNKVQFNFMKIPENKRIKIKSGKTADEDEYANITEIVHQIDGEGVPVLFTIEDLPFTFFLKKHQLEDLFPELNDIINYTEKCIELNNFEVANELKSKINTFIIKIKDKVKYIPNAGETLNLIRSKYSQNSMKQESSLAFLIDVKEQLYILKDLIVTNNHQLVNANSLFKTTGYIKSLVKTMFMEFQNGVLAAQQTKQEKKVNTVLIALSVIIGILCLFSVFFSYQVNQQMTDMTTQINNIKSEVSKITSEIGIDVNQVIDQNVISNIEIPNNPLQ